MAFIREPIVRLIAITHFSKPEDLDEFQIWQTDTDIEPQQLIEAAGRTCYASWTNPSGRTNEQYIANLLEQGHMSVIEHAVASFYIRGISRACSHEIVRHRHFSYCLTGDTKVRIEHWDYTLDKRRGGTWKTLAHLYRLATDPRQRHLLKRIYVRCYDEKAGCFTKGRIKEVYCSGVKPVFRVTLEDGKTITCSADHMFLTPKGWKPLREIVKGLEVSPSGFAVYGDLSTPIMVNGIYAHQNAEWLRRLYHDHCLSMKEIAAIAGVSPGTIRYWIVRLGLSKPVDNRFKNGKNGKVLVLNGVPAYKDPLWLRHHYHEQMLSASKIAQISGVSESTIRAWIRRFGLQKPPQIRYLSRTPWNKGKSYTLNRPLSPEQRALLSELMRGERNHRWKGGVTPKAVQLRRALKALRSTIYARDGYRCRLCGSNANLTLHHIIPIWARPDLAQEPSNLATVCQSCHRKLNGKELNFASLFGSSLPQSLERTQPRRGKRLLLPKWVRIARIEYAGLQMTYDLEMEGPHHNFVANGIVTHNSQRSTRYVDESEGNFIVPDCIAEDPEAMRIFEEAVSKAQEAYRKLYELLREKFTDVEDKTLRRKLARQAARMVLPNATETALVMTGNFRAWRHFIRMRASRHA
ncbi:MAG: FAD-dependent thymidylate synthase, partial [Armatimonadetes bacterium]|nr:FAD-dependent thymidylate synthase [Armatimonadota bacterium]